MSDTQRLEFLLYKEGRDTQAIMRFSDTPIPKELEETYQKQLKRPHTRYFFSAKTDSITGPVDAFKELFNTLPDTQNKHYATFSLLSMGFDTPQEHFATYADNFTGGTQ